jgi:two-component system, OmpR family, heavy metal sensor histidine kinase CusS
MYRFTLTTRLTCLFTLSSALVLLGLGWLTMAAIDRHFSDLDRVTLNDKIHLIREIGTEAQSQSDLSQRLGEVLSSHKDLYVRVQSQASLIYSSANMTVPNLWIKQPIDDGAEDLFEWTENDQTYRGLRSSMPSPGKSSGSLDIWAFLDTRHHGHFLTEFRGAMVAYVILATLLSGLLGWYSARSGLRPLRAMRSRASSITVHRLNERMPAEAVPVEMADLAASLNQMLQRLQSDFRRISEFSSDLAHELRTPVSNMLTETQVELSQPRTVAQYQDVLASNSEELQRLARMISDMLFLATTEHGLALPSCEEILLEDEVLALFDFYDALAEEKRIQLVVSGGGKIEGDRLMVRRALSNLLSNAIRHSPAQGRISIEIECDSECASVHIKNSGADIDSEILPRLFDRFYRADSARVNPSTIGTGLGLSITRAIMQAHKGQVSVTSANGQTCFSLLFPTLQSAATRSRSE